jgi:hypothetical protein
MQQELEEKDEEQSIALKNMLFGQAVMNGDRELFFKFYPQDFGMSEEDEKDLDWQIPENVGDAEAMLSELRELVPLG